MPRRGMHGQPWWHGKFRGCGYRITLGREAVLDALSKTDGHLSADEIYIKLRGRYPNIGLTTVYRTLDVLSEVGLVWRLDFGDGKARYELAEGPKGAHHHHHIVCTECNRVVDYTDFIDDEVELLTRTEKALSEKYGFRITNHFIQFYGLCGECAKSRG